MKFAVVTLACLLWGEAWGAAIPATLSGADLVAQKQLSVKVSSGLTAVVFMSSSCPCSAAHEASLKDLSARFKTVRFVGVHSNADEPKADAATHFAGFAFPVIQDEKTQLADAFGALKTPHVFLLKDGQVIYQGGVDNSQHPADASEFFLKDALEAVAAGKQPAVTRARALGCVIRR